MKKIIALFISFCLSVQIAAPVLAEELEISENPQILSIETDGVGLIGQEVRMTVAFDRPAQIGNVSVRMSTGNEGEELDFTGYAGEVTDQAILTAVPSYDMADWHFTKYSRMNAEIDEAEYIYGEEDLAAFPVSFELISLTQYFAKLKNAGETQISMGENWVIDNETEEVYIPSGLTVAAQNLEIRASERAYTVRVDGELEVNTLSILSPLENLTIVASKSGLITIHETSSVGDHLEQCLDFVKAAENGIKLSGYSVTREQDEAWTWTDGIWCADAGEDPNTPEGSEEGELKLGIAAQWPKEAGEYWFFFEAEESGYYKFDFAGEKLTEYSAEFTAYKKDAGGKSILLAEAIESYYLDNDAIIDWDQDDFDQYYIFYYDLYPIHIEKGDRIYLKANTISCENGTVTVSKWEPEPDLLTEVLDFENAQMVVTDNESDKVHTFMELHVPIKDTDKLRYVSDVAMVPYYMDQDQECSEEALTATVLEDEFVFSKEYTHTVSIPFEDYRKCFDHGRFEYWYKTDAGLADEEGNEEYIFHNGESLGGQGRVLYDARTEGTYALTESSPVIAVPNMAYEVHYRMHLAGVMEEGNTYYQNGLSADYFYQFSIDTETTADCGFYVTKPLNKNVELLIFDSEAREYGKNYPDSTGVRRNFETNLEPGTYYLRVTNKDEDSAGFGYRIDVREPVPSDVSFGASIIANGEKLPVTVECGSVNEIAGVDIQFSYQSSGRSYTATFNSVGEYSCVKAEESGDTDVWRWSGTLYHYSNSFSSSSRIPDGAELQIQKITVTDKYGFSGEVNINDPKDSWYTEDGTLLIPGWLIDEKDILHAVSVNTSVAAKKNSCFYSIYTDQFTIPEEHTVTVDDWVTFTESFAVEKEASLTCSVFCSEGTNEKVALLRTDGNVYCRYAVLNDIQPENWITITEENYEERRKELFPEEEQPSEEEEPSEEQPSEEEQPDQAEEKGFIYVWPDNRRGEEEYNIIGNYPRNSYERYEVLDSVWRTIAVRDMVRPSLDAAAEEETSIMTYSPYLQKWYWVHEKWMSHDEIFEMPYLADETVDYDGEEHALTVLNLPENATVIYKYRAEGERQYKEKTGVTEPGVYDVRAYVTMEYGDEPETTELDATLTIKKLKQKIDWSGPAVNSSNYVKLVAGKTSQITVSAEGECSFVSSKTSVLTVGADGKIKAVSPGKAQITVTAAETDHYQEAQKKITFIVVPAASAIKSAGNSTKGITVKWTKVAGASGYYLYRTKDSGSQTLAATIEKGTTVSYLDTKAKTNGAKYTYKVVPYVKIGTKIYKGSTSKAFVSYYLSTPEKPTVKNSSAGQATVTWKKNSKASGYQIKYVLGTTTKTVTVKKAATVKTVIKNLKKGKTYKIYVRSFKTVKGENYYSAYSAAASLKIIK